MSEDKPQGQEPEEQQEEPTVEAPEGTAARPSAPAMPRASSGSRSDQLLRTVTGPDRKSLKTGISAPRSI